MNNLMPLPEAYQGLDAAQALAQAFFNRTNEWLDAGHPLDALNTYITRFTLAETVGDKRVILREITTYLIRNRK